MSSAERRPRVGIAAMYHSQVGMFGGLDVYVRQLVEALADHAPDGQYLVLTGPGGEAAWAFRPWPDHIRIHGLREFEPRQPWATRATRRWRRMRGQPVPAHYGDAYLARQIDSLGLDLIHYPATLIRPLTLTTPCVLTVFDIQHEYHPEFFTPNDMAWRAANYRPSVEKAAHLITPSRYTAATLAEKYAVPPERMSLAPVGASPGMRRPSPADVAAVRAKYGLPDRYIYYPANPWPHKNHARLIAALARLRAALDAPPALVLSGRLANEPRDARLLAVAAGLEAHVIDLGFVPAGDLAALYTGAQLMVFPSLFEGFGLPLLEAMVCGCPIAAANATAIPECVGEAALLFDPLDVPAMAEAMRALLEDEALRRTLAERGQQRAQAFAWAAIVPALIEAYNRAAAQTKPRAA